MDIRMIRKQLNLINWSLKNFRLVEKFDNTGGPPWGNTIEPIIAEAP